jgi:hypothetical protein
MNDFTAVVQDYCWMPSHLSDRANPAISPSKFKFEPLFHNFDIGSARALMHT